MPAASEVCQCVGGVFNTDTDHTDSGMDADLLSDVVAVLDGDGVDKGVDLLVALLLLDHIDNVLKLGLLGDLLTDRPGHSMTLTYRWAGAQNFTRCLLLMMR